MKTTTILLSTVQAGIQLHHTYTYILLPVIAVTYMVAQYK